MFEVSVISCGRREAHQQRELGLGKVERHCNSVVVRERSTGYEVKMREGKKRLKNKIVGVTG